MGIIQVLWITLLAHIILVCVCVSSNLLYFRQEIQLLIVVLLGFHIHCGLNLKCPSLEFGFAEVDPAAEYKPQLWQVCVVFTCVCVFCREPCGVLPQWSRSV